MAPLRLITLCVSLITCIATSAGAVHTFYYGMKEYTIVIDKVGSPTTANGFCQNEHKSTLVEVLNTATLKKLNTWLDSLSDSITGGSVHQLWIGGKSAAANNANMDLTKNQPFETGAKCVVLSNAVLAGKPGYNVYTKDCSGNLHYICEKTNLVTSSAKYGEIPTYDRYMQRFNNHDHLSMITGVNVYEFKNDDYQFISCIEFVYGKDTPICSGERVTDEKKHALELYKSEFIIEVSGEISYAVKQIKFKTNWGRVLGPVGVTTGIGGFQQVSNNGAPLLYVSGYRGMWLYQLQFHFFSHKVDNLKPLTSLIAQDVYNANKNGDLKKLVKINSKYQAMVPSVGHAGCRIFTYRNDSNFNAYEPACTLKNLLDQLNIYTISTSALKNHLPRNLMKIAQYNSGVLLKSVIDAKAFHTLLTSLTFTVTQVGEQVQGTVVDVNKNVADNLSKYFSSVASFDKKIATADRGFINSKLGTLTTESGKLMKQLNIRVYVMLGIAVAITAADVVEKGINVAIAAGKMANPLGWLFGGNDPNDLADRVKDLTNAIRNNLKAIKLLSTLHVYTKYLKELAGKFANNKNQLKSMKAITDKFSSASASEQAALATEFAENYNNYSPQVSAHDIVYAAELLNSVIGAGCDLIAGADGIIANILDSVKTIIEIPVTLGRQEPSTVCLELQPLTAKLQTMYESVFNFQFEMTEALTRIARANIAEKMAGQISNIKSVQKIEIVAAAIGSMMMEIKTQAVAHSVCQEQEYRNGGKRHDICSQVFFTDEMLEKIAAYKGTAQSSSSRHMAFIPMTAPSGNTSKSYLDVKTLIDNKEAYFQLPIKDKEWMVKYKWLPDSFFSSNFDKETAFFVNTFDMYIPGLKCKGLTNTDYSLQIDVYSDTNVNLYSEKAPPSYIVPTSLFRFIYKNKDSCPSDTIDFEVRKDDADMTKLANQKRCIVSDGKTTNDLKPSVYSSWLIKLLLPQNCQPYLEKPTGYVPLITVYYEWTEVIAKGMKECWPANSRCEPGQRCVDGILSYTCQSN